MFQLLDGEFAAVNETLREKALSIYRAGLAAADPARLVDGLELPLPENEGRLLVFGAGKAAANLAVAVEKRLEGMDYSGRVIVKHGHGGAGGGQLVVEEGGHPLPDEAGLEATLRLLGDLRECGSGDRIIFLLTGGASALLVAPAEGLTLRDKIDVTDGLLRSGATIQELNAVRKHLSAVKGGRLLERMAPASVLTLAISDVIGDDASSIGSGPTVGDPSTFADAFAVLERYRLANAAPERVVDHLQRGASGAIAETPKPGDPVLEGAQYEILASNRNSLAACAEEAEALGFRAEMFAEDMVGSVHERAIAFARALVARRGASTPVALLAGGELTLEVTGSGLGGRSQEFALVAARELSGVEGVVVLAAGSDGTDGPTDAAGAFADGGTWARGRAPEGRLLNNDSYHFFSELGDLLETGPTGTNVNDLFIGLVGGSAV